ncbi:unnamed protein product [Echinostoma caproni]|uniref:EGF-like domain-containing protein n=1 Tax=Echinostoma caproni TaxID=27848 RepID=A0A183A7G9_9TREM|nr:unnamed protein product [Echinostoma caproni]
MSFMSFVGEIFKNGLIALDDLSVGSLPLDYPNNTLSSGERLQHLEGRYLSVFSSVNDGSSGIITVRESDPKNSSLIGCMNAKQIGRLHRLIHLSYPSDQPFEATSILSITWANMTNRIDGPRKNNSFAVIILTNGVSSYATFQYWNIEWPELDVVVSNSLAPEAGIFMRPLGGYQLPRSGHSVQTSLWTTESNVAVPGEWLIPLSDATVSNDKLFELLPKILAEFIQTVQSDCAQDTTNPVPLHEEVLIRRVPKTGNRSDLLNDSPTRPALDFSTEPIHWEGSEYTNEWKDDEEEDEDYTDSDMGAFDTEMWTTGNKEERDTQRFTSDMIAPVEIQDPLSPINPETDFPLGLYDLDANRSFTVERTSDFWVKYWQPVQPYSHLRPASLASVQHITHLYIQLTLLNKAPIVPETYIPLEDDRASESYYSTPDRTAGTETWAPRPEPRVFSTERCDTTVECASAESDCYRVDGNTCCVCREGFYGSGNHHCWREDIDYKFAFNGTLSARLSSAEETKRFVTYLDIQHGIVKRSSSGIRQGIAHDSTYNTLRLLTPMFHILNSLVSSSCANNTAAADPTQREFSIFTLGGAFRTTFGMQFVFDIDYVGRLFVRATFKLDDDTSRSFSRGRMNVEVTADGPITLVDRAYREAYGVTGIGGKSYYTSYHVDQYGRVVFPEQSVKFMAEQRSTDGREVNKDELTVRFSAIAQMQPAAGEDPSGGCLLQSTTIVPRDKRFYMRLRDRGYCSEDCSSTEGSCNLFCVDEPLLFAHEPNSCDCVYCDRDGEICIPEGGSYSCSCRPGLRRMEDRTCRDVPGEREPCGQLSCHLNARCINPAQGFCQCLPGFRGDGIERCEQDPCEDIQCHRDGYCIGGRCQCREGFEGDGYWECRQGTPDPCAVIQCHPNATCQNGLCLCLPGFEGDGYRDCRLASDPCASVRCHHYGFCEAGQCRCLEGYQGDGLYQCTPIAGELCGGHQCHEKAHCVNDRCQCASGYVGDGYRECVPNAYGEPSHMTFK